MLRIDSAQVEASGGDDPACAFARGWSNAVSEFPQFEYSMKDVLRAGDALAGKLIWNDETAPRIREVFSIASNWRDSHAYPMRQIRNLIYHRIRRLRLQGSNTVARLKHMPSIRRKLRDQHWKLNQMQDLGGCRAILPHIEGVNRLIDSLKRDSGHVIYREDPYIQSPKRDGYRCHHLILKFQGKGEASVFNGRRVEIQIRTRLQHSWATAVETVGLFRQENLKAGLGNEDWLRLFKLMSAEFAIIENCPEADDVPKGEDRIREIIELDRKLNAANTLETLSHAVHFADTYYTDPQAAAEYYLIQYDRENRVVTVESRYGARYSVKAYDEAELDAFKASANRGAVLVEADDIESLKSAYPNYFGNVQLFKEHLKRITQGVNAVQYVLPPQQTVPPKPKEKVDLSWFKRRHRW